MARAPEPADDASDGEAGERSDASDDGGDGRHQDGARDGDARDDDATDDGAHDEGDGAAHTDDAPHDTNADDADAPLHVTPTTARRVARLVDELGGAEGVETSLRVLDEEPAQAILADATTHDAGLIVIATQGLSGLEHFLLGSVTERVVRSAECPVLTLRGKAL